MFALGAPWYVLAEQHTPGFLHYFVVGEHWYRFTVPGWSGDHYGSAHVVPRGTIWLYALGACAPWTVLLPLTAIGRCSTARSSAPPEQPTWWRYLLLWGLAPCVFFTGAGNIIWTYVLPGLPALAMLAASWLKRDLRQRRVDAFVAAGLVVVTVGFAGILVNKQVTDGFTSAKAVVAAFDARKSGDDVLIFVGGHLYSPAFYSRGKAERLDATTELGERIRTHDSQRLGRGTVFVALKVQQGRELPSELRDTLRFRGRFGAYELFSVATEKGL